MIGSTIGVMPYCIGMIAQQKAQWAWTQTNIDLQPITWGAMAQMETWLQWV